VIELNVTCGAAITVNYTYNSLAGATQCNVPVFFNASSSTDSINLTAPGYVSQSVSVAPIALISFETEINITMAPYTPLTI